MAKTPTENEPKSLTIQKVPQADREQFHAQRGEQSPAEYLNFLLNSKVHQADVEALNQVAEIITAQGYTTIQEVFEKIFALTKQNAELSEENGKLINQINDLKGDVMKMISTTEEMTEELNTLKNREPEEKIIEKQIELTGLQFICEPSDETLKLARKYRSFLRRDGLIEGPEDEYPSRLFDLAVKKFLTNRFE